MILIPEKKILLNAVLVIGTDGDEYLEYDDADLDYAGNSLTPDISSVGDHDARSFQVTHAIYTTSAEPHPAIIEEGVMIRTDADHICITEN